MKLILSSFDDHELKILALCTLRIQVKFWQLKVSEKNFWNVGKSVFGKNIWPPVDILGTLLKFSWLVRIQHYRQSIFVSC